MRGDFGFHDHIVPSEDKGLFQQSKGLLASPYSSGLVCVWSSSFSMVIHGVPEFWGGCPRERERGLGRGNMAALGLPLNTGPLTSSLCKWRYVDPEDPNFIPIPAPNPQLFLLLQSEFHPKFLSFRLVEKHQVPHYHGPWPFWYDCGMIMYLLLRPCMPGQSSVSPDSLAEHLRLFVIWPRSPAQLGLPQSPAPSQSLTPPHSTARSTFIKLSPPGVLGESKSQIID